MAWFTFTDASEEIFLVQLTDPEEIAHARALLDGSETADARIGGTVVKAEADYNVGWSFHLDPDSIFFFEISTEVGDSTMRFIEEHLDEVGGELLPGNVWTPWTSELVDELAERSGTGCADVILGTDEADILFGLDGADRLVASGGDDYVIGDTGRDNASGGGGDDKLGGGAGCDLLRGGDGADVLDGGEGSDRLHGGRGEDQFLIDAAVPGDRDVILDLQAGGDVIGLDSSWLDLVDDETGNGIVDAADVAASFERAGDDLVLEAGDAVIVLAGMAGHVLGAEDFLIS